MDIDITGRHISVTDAMREHALDKIEHLGKYSDQILRVQMTLNAEADERVAELVASVRRSSPLVAEARSDDMYVAIDAAVAKLQEQIRRHKERHKDHRGRARAGDVPVSAEEPEASDEDEWEEAGEAEG